MIYKQTWLNVSDNTNVSWFQVFHLYKGFYRKVTEVGYFLKGTARVVEPPRLEYKGFRVRFNKKGDICRGLLIRTRYRIKRKDGTALFFKNNSTILLKKKQEVKSKYLYGPAPHFVRRKRFLVLFSAVV